MSTKQYGLIIPSKHKKHVPQAPVARPSIFEDDSDSDTPQPVKPTGAPIQTKACRQDISSQNKAIEEDPTVFQYDEIYDEMDQNRKDSKLARKDLDKKPKYITKLLAAADKRKRENERRVERQVQKDREAEGDQFKDKEAFVTSSYKKKLEELRIQEEQEKREEYLESIGDVKKQGNLDGFYRHLYDQKVNYNDKIKERKNEQNKVKNEPLSDSEEEQNNKNNSSNESGSDNEETVNKGTKKQSDLKEKSTRKRSSTSDESDAKEKQKKVKKNVKKRSYRTRKDSENDQDEGTNAEIKKEHIPSNLDADSDFSIDSSDSEEENSLSKKTVDKNKEKDQENKNNLPEKANVLSDNAAFAKSNDSKDKNKKDLDEKKEAKDKGAEINEEKPKKPKVNIWKKRTVGVVFDEAVKRYFERKAIRESTTSG